MERVLHGPGGNEFYIHIFDLMLFCSLDVIVIPAVRVRGVAASSGLTVLLYRAKLDKYQITSAVGCNMSEMRLAVRSS